jgi:hypothetical protein
MIFLIEYDRPTGTLVQFRRFDDSERQIAQDVRLELELKLNSQGNRDHEVVILEAPSEEAVRHTHGRYFKGFSELANEWVAKHS